MSTDLIPVERIDEDTVNLLVIYNALNIQDRELTKLVHDPCKTLADYMVGLPQPEMWSVAVNAEPYAPEEWAMVYPGKDDFITVIPIPYGGGKSKNILRLAAMIAVAVFAPQVAVAYGLTGTAALATTAAVTMAGSMLVNALLPLPKPSLGGYGDASESPTYGADGAKNTSVEETPVPLIYGEFRYAGNIVNVKSDNQGDTQLITAQMVVSEGPIESISDFQVQGQPIDNYEDVDTVVRLGTGNQSITNWFASTTRMINKSITLSRDFTTHTTTIDVDAFRVDVVFPNGLSEVNKNDGKRLDRTVEFDIEYRAVGTSRWNSISPKQLRPLSNSSIPAAADRLRVEYQQRITGTGSRAVTGNLFVRVGSGDWVLKQTKSHTVSLVSGSGFLSGAFSVSLSDMASGTKSYKVEWTGASPTLKASARYALTPSVTAKTGQPLRRSFLSPVLPESVYEVRIKRNSEESSDDLKIDRVALTDIAEIVDERVRYNHTAFYGVRVRLSDQLSGLPQMTAKVKGIKVKHYDYSGNVTKTAWSDNPAWIVLDMLTNTRYGAGLPLSRIDLRMFVEWAEFCSDQKLYFNGVIDTFSNVWDACQVVLRVGHARFVSIGNVYSLTIYRASEPVMLFGAGNIVEGTLQLSWQSLEDRANEFEVEYFDRENGNKASVVRVLNEAALARGEPQRISTIRMIGVDNQRQALHEAHFQKALNENLIMTGQLEATVESLACGVGDVVLIQHDMPEWGESGRIKPGSTRTVINIDRPLGIGANPADSSFLILHPAVLRGTGTISVINTANKIVYLTGLSTSIRARRLRVGSRDLLIKGMAASGGYLEVSLESVSGLSVGNGAELWDTDVIETRKVQSYSASANQITLAGPLSVDPQDFANYMVGKSNLSAKPVSITGISGTGEYKRTIKFIEYNHTVFDPENAEPTPIYTRPVTRVQHVRDLRVIEEVTMRTGSLTADLLITWTPPADGNYAGAQIFMSRNGGPLLRHGTAAAGATAYHTSANFGESVLFKVVAYDGAGRVADFDTAPIFEYQVVKTDGLPGTVQNFRATLGMDGVELMWTLIDDPDIAGYEIREGASWQAGNTLVKNVSSNRFFSTEKDHSYTYWIKATDITGKQSASAAMATVTDLLKPAMPTSVEIEVSSFTVKLMPQGLSPGALWQFKRSDVALATNQIEANAVDLGRSTVLTDTGLRHGTTYFYYIRGVNAFGVGDWYPIQATTKTDIPEILDALAGQVRETHLWGNLNSRIDLIDGPDTLTGSVANLLSVERSEWTSRLADEALARSQQITQETQDRAAELEAERLSRIAAVTAERDERVAQIVAEQGARASAIQSEANQRVSGDQALSSRINSLTTVFDGSVADFNNQVQALVDADTAIISSVTSLQAEVAGNASAIINESNARASADSSLASQISIISARLDSMPTWNNGFEEGDDYDLWQTSPGNVLGVMTSDPFVGARSARISSTETDPNINGAVVGVQAAIPVATGEVIAGYKVKISAAARWNRTSGMGSSEFAIGHLTVDGANRVFSGWQRFGLTQNWRIYDFFYDIPQSAAGAEQFIVIWGDTSGSGKEVFVDRVMLQVAEAEISDISASIDEERQARIESDEALASSITSVNSRVNGVEAQLITEQETRSTADSALSSQITLVNGRVDASNAAIALESSARVSGDNALSSQLATLTSQVSGNAAAIINEASARASGDSALATSISSLQSSIADDLAVVDTAAKTLTQGASLVRNGLFATGDLMGWPGSWGSISVVTKDSAAEDQAVQTIPAGHAAMFADSGQTSLRYLYGDYMPATAGDTYTVRVDYAASAGATVRFRVYAQWRNDDTGTTTTNNFLVSNASVEWQRSESRNWVAPAGTTRARIYVRRETGYAGRLYVSNILAYRSDEAMASLVSTVQSNLEGSVGIVQSNLNTQVSRLDGRVDTVASSVSTVSSKADSNTAAIASEATTRANADSALAGQITTAQSTLNGQISSVQQSLSTSIQNVDKRVDGLADPTNLAANGSFYTGDATGWTNVSAALSVVPGIDRGGKIAASHMMQFPNNSASYTPRSSYVPVREGEKFGVSFDYAHGGTGAANRFRALVQWLNASGGTISTQYGITRNATTAWQRYEPHVFTAPAGAASARFGFHRLDSNPGTGYATNLLATRVDAVLGAQYTLKLDVNGFVSGFGAYNDGTTSDFGVIANRFYVAAPGSTSGAMPFLVSGNTVYMNEALIQTLTIGKLRTSTGGVVVENNRIKAEYIDANNLDVRSAARFSGDVQSGGFIAGSKGWRIRQNGTVEFNEGTYRGPVQFSQVSGAGSLASKNSVAYTEITGTKPPSDADKTSSNTAYDTARVAGTTASTVLSRANAGNDAATRVNSWTRPTSTLIDGNKIFTGDAYVDTLQIKGQAVTVPATSTGGSITVATGNPGNMNTWSSYATLNEVIINPSPVSGRAWIFWRWRQRVTTGSNAGIRLYVRLRIVETDTLIDSRQFDLVSGNSSMDGTQESMNVYSFPANAKRTIRLEYIYAMGAFPDRTTAVISNRLIGVLFAKR